MSLVMTEKKQNIIEVIKNYGSRLFGFIRNRVNTNEDAEDILQDVWYQLSSQAKFEDIESISGWLYRVARNRITDTYRKKKEALLEDHTTNGDDVEWQLPGFLLTDSTDPETEQLRKLFWEELIEALQDLPENQRNVFVWNELEDRTLQEIADQEKENIKTIISRKRYSVQHLRKRLENLYNDFLND
jgi:RNA polymerase sigma factor (sigma-70 family)